LVGPEATAVGGAPSGPLWVSWRPPGYTASSL